VARWGEEQPSSTDFCHSMYVSHPVTTWDIWCIPISTDRLQKSCPNQGFLVPSHPVNFRVVPLNRQGPGSVVSIATAYGLDGLGIESRWGRDFPLLSRLALRPIQPPVQWVPELYLYSP
jgi:hypothetical protein